ncbi:MAG: hypothetical protein ABII82_11365 [Verrucomicrobiota bacterium]
MREISREFPVTGRPDLDIELSFGELELVAGPEGMVKIEVTQSLSLKDEARADRALEDWRFEFSQTGDRVRMEGSSRRNVIWDWDPVRQVHCTVRITAPRACNLSIKGVQVRTEIDRIDGDVVLRTDGGRFYAQHVAGDFSAKTLGGQVVLSSAAGAVDVNIGTGQVLIGTASGPVDVSSQGGVVEIQQAADAVKIRGDTLDVLLGLANPRRGEASVRTAVGSIVLKVEQTASVLIDATAPWLGEVKARGLELDVLSGAAGSSRLKARLNDGDSKVRLRASGGLVSIVGVEPLGLTLAAGDR